MIHWKKFIIMIKKIVEFYLKPFNFPKTKVYLFSTLAGIFICNLIYVKISADKELLEILSENTTPTIILIAIIFTFIYMIYVDSNYAKRNQETNRLIIKIVEKSNISESLKEKLIDKIN